jgi:hypothetical protein
MGRGLPFLAKFARKFGLEVLPTVFASVAGAYLVSELHLLRTPDQAQSAAPAGVQSQVPVPTPVIVAVPPAMTASEERALTRELLRARREGMEPPAEVKPQATGSIAPRETAEPDGKPIAASRPEVVALPAPSARKPLSPQRTTVDVSQPAPTDLRPITVSAEPPREPAPPETGVGAKIFSKFSTIVGTAANVTGDTINFVIDLPGKAITAGGRLLGTGGSQPQPPPNRQFSNTPS